MSQEEEIKQLRRQFLELSEDYYKFRISIYYRTIFYGIILLLGLITGLLL